MLLPFQRFRAQKRALKKSQLLTNILLKKKVDFNYSNIEINILDLVNEHRENIGLGKLKPMAEISVEAESHNYYMLEQERVSHDNFMQRYHNLVKSVNARAVSENVAFGYRTADAVVKAWLNSDGHKVNIEGDHTHFGVSVLKDDKENNYFTNIFVRK